MKKTLKVILICLLAAMCALCIVACNSTENQGGGDTPAPAPVITDGDKVIGEVVEYEGNYERPKMSQYGKEPDLDEVVIDGRFDESIWQNKNWYTNFKAENPEFKFSVTTHMTDGGLYIAAQSNDKFLFWNGRNYFYSNTHMVFKFDSGYSFKVDCNNTPPTQDIINVRSRYEGALNKFNEGEGLFIEGYITWQQLGYSSKPETIKMLPTYYWAIVRNRNNELKLPFSSTGTSANQYYEFDTNGYTDCDDENAKVGAHKSGLSKSNGWKVSNPGTDEETISTLTGAQYTGYYKYAFFREARANRFMVTTRVTVNSNKGNSRAGLLMYSDSIKYRAYAIELTKEVYSNNKLTKLPIKAYTNYPSNITVTTDVATLGVDTGAGRQANQFDLTIFANNGLMYYLVNGKFVYSEEITYVQTCFIGFYAYNADVTFSNYNIRVMNTDEEVKAEIGKYAYTVEVKNESSQAVVGELAQIATSNDGTGTVDVNLIFKGGRVIDDKTYRRNFLTDLFYEVVETGEKVSLMEEYNKAVGGVVTVRDVPGNIVVHVRGEGRNVDRSEMVELKIDLHCPQTNSSVIGVNVSLKGNTPDARYDLSITNQAALSSLVPKGIKWSFVATKSGYRSASGELNGGNPINEDMKEAGVFTMNTAIVGGVASSADDARYDAATNSYVPAGSFTMASVPAQYWDLSQEEYGKVTFTSTNTGSSEIYYSGKSIAEYQVAYVELTNQTDYMAFQSIEDDPGVGFVVRTQSYNTLCALRQTGVRIIPGSVVGWNPTDVNGLMNYKGNVALIDRKNNGKVLSVNPGIGSVNRVPYEGETTTTSLLMIRRNGNVYMYAADGRADVKPDGTNFNKMKLIYSAYIPDTRGPAAIGFRITVSYNLRMDFENYWILAGQSQASKFADPIISTGLRVEEGKDLITLKSDGLSNYNKETAEGSIAISSQLVVSPAKELPAGKVIKLTLGNKTVYLNSKNSEGVMNIDSIERDVVVKAQLVNATTIKGNISTDDSTLSLAERGGSVVDANGEEVATFVTDKDGYYTVVVPEGEQLSIRVNIPYYAATSVKVTPRGNSMTVKEMEFSKINIGSPAGTLATTAGMEYGIDEKYNGLYAHWESSKAGDALLTVNTESEMENFVLTFSYVRSSAAENSISGSTDETDLGLGIIVNGSDATNIQFLNIGTGYRILHPSWEGRDEKRGIGRVNFQSTSIGMNNYAQVKIVKLGSTFYLMSKYANDSEYKLTVAFNAVNDSGVQILQGPVSFAIKMTVTQGRYLNMTFFDINVSEPNIENAPEVFANVNVQQPTEGSITVVGQNADSFAVPKNSKVNLSINVPAEKRVASIKVNGVAQAIDGVYNNGVYTGSVLVENDADITVEFAYVTYVSTATIAARQTEALSIKATNGKEEFFFTISLNPNDISDSVAIVKRDDKKLTIMLPKGTWTVTLYKEATANTAIGNPVTIEVK